MCFVWNKDLDLTDHVVVAVQKSGVENETNTGLWSEVVTAMTPRNFKGDYMTAKQKMIEVVGSCSNETLEEYSKKKCDLSNHDTRIDIAMDTLDKILFIIEKPKFEGPHDPGDENDNPKTKKTS